MKFCWNSATLAQTLQAASYTAAETRNNTAQALKCQELVLRETYSYARAPATGRGNASSATLPGVPLLLTPGVSQRNRVIPSLTHAAEPVSWML